jgi:hypothetical protein
MRPTKVTRKPYAGKPHVRIDDGVGETYLKSLRSTLLDKSTPIVFLIILSIHISFVLLPTVRYEKLLPTVCMENKNLVLELYKNSRTVFRLQDVAMLIEESNSKNLKRRLNYYVKSGHILNIRRGIYVKPDYKIEELGCLLYTPSYISLEYVLQRAGVIFQYDSAVTNVSYLSRDIIVEGQTIRYRQIKGEILVNQEGLILRKNNINIATPERAFLDMLYLNNNFYFDNIHPLNKLLIRKLVQIYNSKRLEEKVTKLFSEK